MMDREPDMGKLATAHFGHLPVWIDGNAYFEGAKGFKKEKHAFADEKTKVHVDVAEKDGSYYIESNIFDLIKDFKVDMISTDTLGAAFEPGQKYENPDGTPITFDYDYNGNHRGADVIPGPFATVEAAKAKL